jgi:ABC-type bacteriocin/lantibiotic exporter with double-glycine peptidase domain
MSNSIYRIWQHLTQQRKRQLIVLLLVMLIASFAEVISIGAIFPFLGALTAPEVLFNHWLSKPLNNFLKINNPQDLLLPFTLIFVIFVIISATLRVLLLWLQSRLGHAIGTDFSIEIYKRTLYQPYQTHLARNSSEVISGISGKVNQLVYQGILPLLMIASSLLMLMIIIVSLLFIDPLIAIITFGGFGGIYYLVIFFTRKRLFTNSQRISLSSNQAIKILQEGLGGIRDVLIDGTQKIYCTAYYEADVSLRRAQAYNQIISGVPRFFIEALGISLIAILAYGITQREQGFAQAVPILGALALGAQRLLPVMQQLYSSWSSLKGAQASINDALELINQPLPNFLNAPASKPIEFNKSIRINNVNFNYDEQSRNVLNNISLEIKKGSRVGFIGTTGSGKSTLLDIIMGLLPPTAGTLEVDGHPITIENCRSWQVHVAHVPQTIFLADISIAENIAFGIPFDAIDFDRVRIVAEKAQIAKTIESWERQYQTLVGEKGIRLSGGERQRIGIARALYKRADVIIFDEATSALDNETEALVMDAINTIDDDITVLMVAHRLSTLKNCNIIYKLQNAKAVKIGTVTQTIHSPTIDAPI